MAWRSARGARSAVMVDLDGTRRIASSATAARPATRLRPGRAASAANRHRSFANGQPAAGTFRRVGENIRRGPCLPDMPAELSDRLEATDAALRHAPGLRRPVRADAALPAPPRAGLPLRAAVVRFGGRGRGRHAGRVRAPATRAGDFDTARGALQPWLLGIARNFVHRRTGADARFVANDDDAEPAAPAPDDYDPAARMDAQRDLARLRTRHRRAAAALPRRARAGRAGRALVCRSRRHLRLRTQHRPLAAVPGARPARALARPVTPAESLSVKG